MKLIKAIDRKFTVSLELEPYPEEEAKALLEARKILFPNTTLKPTDLFRIKIIS